MPEETVSVAPGGNRSALDRVLDLFTRQYGSGPEVVASAPGRVNLIGEHTDYNGGDVLPIGIDLRTYVAVAPCEGCGESVAVSTGRGEPVRLVQSPLTPAGNWGDYPAGVVWAFAEKGVQVPPLRIAVQSDVPAGAGLSSSAALEVAFAFAVCELLQLPADARELALVAWRAESAFVGVPCGIMDQFASAIAQKGTALHIRAAQSTAEPIPFSEYVLIFDTASPRSLRGSEFATRQRECAQALEAVRQVNPSVRSLADATHADIEQAGLSGAPRKRALHVVEEQQRVATAVEALLGGGTLPGELLYQSHQSLRVQYECSTPELDWFVENAAAVDGVRGARMTGAGWGGCAIAVGGADALQGAAPRLRQAYQEKFHRRPGSWVASAEQGARIELRRPARGSS